MKRAAKTSSQSGAYDAMVGSWKFTKGLEVRTQVDLTYLPVN